MIEKLMQARTHLQSCVQVIPCIAEELYLIMIINQVLALSTQPNASLKKKKDANKKITLKCIQNERELKRKNECRELPQKDHPSVERKFSLNCSMDFCDKFSESSPAFASSTCRTVTYSIIPP